MARPTSDPKTRLLAFRLAPRHVALLDRLATQGGVSMSQALRALLDAHGARPRRRSKKTPTPSEWQRFATKALFGVDPRP